MSSWARELGEYLADDSHIIVERERFERLNLYDSIGQPTNPSVGRAYRTKGGLLVIVEDDPQPGWVRRVGRLPLFLDEATVA